jgi:hypothetical protein
MGETVDVLGDSNSSLSGRQARNVHGARGVSKRMYQYEAELHQIVQEREKTSNDALHQGIRSLPVLLEQSRTVPHICNVRSVDPELIYYEDKLGCARGVVWGFVFEAVLVIAIAIFWKLRFSLR